MNGIQDMATTKKSRNQLKREKKKAKKSAASASESEYSESEGESVAPISIKEESVAPSIVDEILSETAAVDDGDSQMNNAQFEAFKDVFAKFKTELESEDQVKAEDVAPVKGEIIYSDEDASSEGSDAENGEKEKISSKRRLRKANRLSVAELKRLVKRPELVEWVDVTAMDPRLLLAIKSYRNVVPIPQHWSQKRDYLQSKRGLEKPPFQLPSYIADTGIATQRDAVKEKESEQSLKQKTRERVQPKMGKIDIDYQKLHDAFFKYQTAPKMTPFGQMYYEGKEFETQLTNKRPGDLSKDLIEALSIPPLAPPPWIIAMQRYGPPPSYPHLKIPGVNAPIPEGAQFGFHPGGWGRPQLDEFNRPVYPGVFDTEVKDTIDPNADQGLPIVRDTWGELEPDEEVEEEEEEEDEMEEDADEGSVDQAGLQTPSGLATPSGLTSVSSTIPGGMETPDFLELRKRRDGTESVVANERREFATVLQERKADSKSSRGLLGSERTYDMSNVAPVLGQEDDRRSSKRKAGDVDLALDPAELEGMSEQSLRDKYEAQRKASGGAGQGSREDFSDFVAEELAKKRARSSRSDRDKDRDRGSSRRQEKDKFKF